MADQKLTALSAITALSTDDLLYGVDDPGGTPASKKITAGNALGPIAAGLVSTATKTGTYTAVAGDLVICNTSGGAFTVTLPATPAPGARVGVYLLTAGNNLTVGRNSVNIDGAGSDLTISALKTLRVLQYNGSQWLTVDATGDTFLASQYNITTTSAYEDTGLSIALPLPGLYEITYNIRGYIGGSGWDIAYLVVELYDSTAAAAVVKSERFLLMDNWATLNQIQAHLAYSHQVYVTVASTIKLYAKRETAGGTPSWGGSAIMADSAGYTTLSYKRLA